MKTDNCTCGQLLFFENIACVNCRREVGFLPDLICTSSLDFADKGLFAPTTPEARGKLYKKCQNFATVRVCNWMIPSDSTEVFCTSCRLDLVIPDLSLPRNVELWGGVEAAKRRFVYSALRLRLPLANRTEDPKRGLGFRFMADATNPDGSIASHVMTEHDHGLITLNIAEADDAERERIRLGMKEPYRTLLGHFRHETGHYYWDRLVLDSPLLERFREIFGDERQNYDDALKKYYAEGAPPDWQNSYISVYATMHPWEDWAETWAHYLHIQDTLEVAADFGLVGKHIRIDPKGTGDGEKPALVPRPFDQVLEAWVELTVALNCINRSMGLRDLYPFVLSKPVADKLYFISEVIAGTDTGKPPAS